MTLLLTACAGAGSVTTTPGTLSTTTLGATATAVAKEEPMKLASPAFEEREMIPTEYTCDGDNVSPPLQIDNLPEGALTLVLIVDDPDAPGGTWDHWVAFDIAPASEITRDVGELGIAGLNSWGTIGYGGPCPPSGTHRYVHQVYALDTELGLAEGATKSEVLEAMEGHIIAAATLTGVYER